MKEKKDDFYKNLTDEQLILYLADTKKDCKKYLNRSMSFIFVMMFGLIGTSFTYFINLFAGLFATIIFAGLCVTSGVSNKNLKIKQEELKLINKEVLVRERKKLYKENSAQFLYEEAKTDNKNYQEKTIEKKERRVSFNYNKDYFDWSL